MVVLELSHELIVFAQQKKISNERSTIRSHWNSNKLTEQLLPKRTNTWSSKKNDNINHVLTSPIAVFTSFIIIQKLFIFATIITAWFRE